jgi:hypothetical protein
MDDCHEENIDSSGYCYFNALGDPPPHLLRVKDRQTAGDLFV